MGPEQRLALLQAEDGCQRSGSNQAKLVVWPLKLAFVAVVVGLAGVAIVCVVKPSLLFEVLKWIRHHQVAGVFTLSALHVGLTVILIPPGILGVVAGAIFGLWIGTAIVWFSSIVGESTAFLLGRFLLRGWVAKLTRDFDNWQAIEAALTHDGWKLVVLLRLAPLLPFVVINYAFGLTSLPFWQYLWPSMLGCLPGSVLYVYLGTQAKDLRDAMTLHSGRNGRIWIAVGSVISCVVVLLFTTFYAKRAIQRRLQQNLSEECPQPADLRIAECSGAWQLLSQEASDKC